MTDKEKEAFEAWLKSIHYEYEVSWRVKYNCYNSRPLNDMYKAWQAAKAQAIPDGFVLVDEDTIEDIKDSFSLLQEDIAVHRDYGTEHTARRDFNEILERVTKLKAMIEVQESAND